MHYNVRFYKPKKSGDGTASKVELTVKKHRSKNFDQAMIFWDMAPQVGIDEKGNAKFAWEGNKLTFKLGMADATDILCVLRGIKPVVGIVPKQGEKAKGLFHKSLNSNSSLQFGVTERNDAYAVRLSVQKDGNVTALSHLLTLPEGESLRILLEQAILQMMEIQPQNKD